jgi:hypothetical protein
VLLPLRLFFDNDYPDPKTRKSVTTTSYETLVSDYLSKLEEYKAAFSVASAQMEVSTFFTDSVKGNYDKLETFTNQVLNLLNSGKSLNIKLRGHASPLAESAYNVTLSSRRISSVRNFWLHWNNGVLQPFMLNGTLKIDEDHAGESQTKSGVSDNRKNKSASVYSPAAAEERRIEVTEITIY